MPRHRSRSFVVQTAAGFFEAVPDLKLAVVSSSIHNGHGVAECVLSGTDKGPKFSVRGASMVEMRGGKCSSNKAFYDFTIMRQVGVLPPEKPVSAQ